jgi:hypothetical protein
MKSYVVDGIRISFGYRAVFQQRIPWISHENVPAQTQAFRERLTELALEPLLFVVIRCLLSSWHEKDELQQRVGVASITNSSALQLGHSDYRENILSSLKF